jgi:hypothetical protein
MENPQLTFITFFVIIAAVFAWVLDITNHSQTCADSISLIHVLRDKDGMAYSTNKNCYTGAQGMIVTVDGAQWWQCNCLPDKETE